MNKLDFAISAFFACIRILFVFKALICFIFMLTGWDMFIQSHSRYSAPRVLFVDLVSINT